MNIYSFIKYIHVLSAMVAFGANITYMVWFAQVGAKPEALPFTLRTIKRIDDWIANPAYILLVPSGLGLASIAGWRLTEPWLLVSLVLYTALALIGLGMYSPTLKKQIAAAERVGPNAPAYKVYASRSTLIGITLNLLSLSIIFLMVTKPALWK
jgi:uncharacterized membrane protein